jgi:uncharacterized membrane protein
MGEEKITAHRLAAFSDAVFAVIVTVMVLELRCPTERGARRGADHSLSLRFSRWLC